MKTKQIGTLTFGKFSTNIHITEEIEKLFKSQKISLSTLIPAAWVWYDHELLELIDENGDGKPDEKFGKDFKIIYVAEASEAKEFEQTALEISRTEIKGIRLERIIVMDTRED